MFKHILVPLDGSQLAEAALPVAASLAEKLGAKITLIHVIERDAPGQVHGQPHLKEEAAAERYLADVASRGFPQGLRVDSHVHTAGVDDVARSLVEHALELKYDLIVMCSHGRGGALRLVLGSIAQKVISMGSLPVLITNPGDKEEAQGFPCEALLVPFDGDVEHAQALPFAVELARTCEVALHLAMVVPTLGTLSAEAAATGRLLPRATSRMLEMSAKDAEEGLQARVQELRDQGLNANAHVLRGDPAGVIVDFARRLRADLVVLATHGRLGMGAFWEGSVANSVCSRCTAPVLLVPVEKD
jgi:nucleotide-binding universal stress UspA family protein